MLHHEDNFDDASSVRSASSNGRGRPRVIEAWTRVISIDDDDLEVNHKHPLNIDLMMSQNLPKAIKDKDKDGW